MAISLVAPVLAGAENLPTFEAMDETPAAGTIAPAVVIDSEQRRWNLMPEAWREHGPLCSGTTVYQFRGDRYLSACRLRSAWSHGDVGYC